MRVAFSWARVYRSWLRYPGFAGKAVGGSGPYQTAAGIGHALHSGVVNQGDHDTVNRPMLLQRSQHDVARVHVFESVQNRLPVGRDGETARSLEQFGRNVGDGRDLLGMEIQKA